MGSQGTDEMRPRVGVHNKDSPCLVLKLNLPPPLMRGVKMKTVAAAASYEEKESGERLKKELNEKREVVKEVNL